jgi:site-specific DNA recombinase
MGVIGELDEWAGRSGGRCVAGLPRGCLRFAFYGRVSIEDWQDPASSRARQREQAGALVRGHGRIMAEFFDVGESRSTPAGGAARTTSSPTRIRKMWRGGCSPSG